MATKPHDPAAGPAGDRKLPRSAEDRKALELAETTDLSEQQARDLIARHGLDSPELAKEARTFKAEG
jgi:hypothetical protein